MQPLLNKLQPVKGFSHAFHVGLVALLPLLLLLVLHFDYLGLQLAVALVLLSKWRMLAVRPRFWLALIRANGVDLIVGIAVVVFMQLLMVHLWAQCIFVALYIGWLLYIKPGTSILMVSLQAFVAQLAGLMALYLAWPDGSLYGLVIMSALICYLSARHFFDSFEEPYSRMLAYLWAYFAAGLVWVLGHWLLIYGFVAQPVIVLTAIGYGLAVLYYLDHHEKLNKLLRRQTLAIMLVVLLVLIVFSDWGDKVV
jgi:hypothetical protein